VRIISLPTRYLKDGKPWETFVCYKGRLLFHIIVEYHTLPNHVILVLPKTQCFIEIGQHRVLLVKQGGVVVPVQHHSTCNQGIQHEHWPLAVNNHSLVAIPPMRTAVLAPCRSMDKNTMKTIMDILLDSRVLVQNLIPFGMDSWNPTYPALRGLSNSCINSLGREHVVVVVVVVVVIRMVATVVVGSSAFTV
jgi:hypothetical protein